MALPRRPISLKVYSITLSLLVLMVAVTALSARNLRVLNNEVAALSHYYIPLDQQAGSVETLVRQQIVHVERILLLLQTRGADKAAIEEEKRLFDQRGINADQVIDSSLRLIDEALSSAEISVDRVALSLLKRELPEIQAARQQLHATFRQFLIESDEGNPRSLGVVRNALAKEKDGINRQLEQVIVALEKTTQDAADRAQAEEQRAIRLNWSITVIAGALGLLLAALITRNLVEPVRRLLGGTRAVEQGDLSIQIHADSADEIAALTESFNHMVSGLREKDAINRQLEKTILALEKTTQDAADRARAEEEKAIRLNWAITIIASVLGLILAAIITRNLVEPVRRLLSGTKAVEQGDLNVRIQANSADEIAALTESFNNMVAGLREKERIKDTFGKYVDPRIVTGLLENRLAASGGQKKTMTVFFSDLAGFTTMCEHLTPDGVVRFLNQYFTLMSEPIREHNGILDKFIGDAIMAYWGPPFTGESEHAALACSAALDQMARLERFRALLPDILGMRKGLPEVGIRMGISTGDVTVGNIGSESAKGFTVIGDTVNLASRLEGANKEYGTGILISEDTWKMAGDAIEAREVDSIRVVGKTEPLRVFELLGRKGESSLDELRTGYEEGLRHYRNGDLDAAEACFAACLKIRPGDGPSQVLIARLRHFRANPDARRADGVWDLKKK